MSFWECLPHLLRIYRNLENRGEAKRLASGIVFQGRRKSSKRNATDRHRTKTPRRTAAGRLRLQIANQCFFLPEVDVLVEPIVVVPVVPDVVVEVVPVVDVAVVEVMAVPEVSVEVPPGIAEVEVPELVVSVAIVPVVLAVSVDIVDEVSVEAALVSVLLLLVSLLQAKPKTLSARTVTRTRSFLLIKFFLSINVVLWEVGLVGKECLLTPLGNRLKSPRSGCLANLGFRM
jgi:hypothetical protein